MMLEDDFRLHSSISTNESPSLHDFEGISINRKLNVMKHRKKEAANSAQLLMYILFTIFITKLV